MKKILFLILTLCTSGMAYSDITWSAPTTISTTLTDAEAPKTVIDVNNNITAIWIENDDIMASSLPSGGSWSTPVAISNASNTSSNPTLGIDSSGNVTALWIENTQIQSATLPFGGSWSAGTVISGTGASSPSLGVNASGDAVAVWSRSGFVESSTRISGTWSLVSVLSAANSSFPHIAVNNGNALAAWHTLNVNGTDVIVTNLLTISSNTWGTPKNVFTGTAARLHNYPKIAIDFNGNGAIAWFRYDLIDGNAYQNVQVLVSTLSYGAAAWSVPSILTASGLRNPADLTIKLRFDTSGNALVVWTNSYDGQTFTIESSLKLFGGSWSSPALVYVPSLYAFDFDVALASGTALLTNTTWDQVSAIQIIAQETDTTNPIFQAWTYANPVSTGDNSASPKCAISISGGVLNAVVVWVSFDGTNNVINVATGTDSVIEPPLNVSVTQDVIDYGVYQDYTNTITWDASSNPNIIQYNIYRNGIYFAATDSGTFQFIDHNAVQGETVTYGVAALTSSFRQSDIITFTLFP
ncbi:MAG TPA: hypothetical protein VGP47_09275 [Parachlamydiaceae bacterium]|nr:hypothetical protein [Parachlamydiaceae bacterium]